MVPYQMNMARGQVLSAETRRHWRQWLVVYFVAVLVVLGISVGLLTRDWARLRHQKQLVDSAERQFLGQRPGAASVGDELRRLSREMSACEAQLNAVDGFRKSECHAGAILLGLVKDMPVGVSLGHVAIDAASAGLGVEVYVPAGRKADDTISPPRLIGLWNAEPLLKDKVTRITSEKSERVQVGGVEMMNWRFAGTLGGGGR